MKHIYIIINLLFSVLFYTSCIEDSGNYDYTPAEGIMPLTISGFDDMTILRNNELSITPIVENMGDASRYSHVWYTLPAATISGTPQRDTLALTQNISVPIKYAGGSYHLYYQIRDKKLDIYTYKRITLTVTESNIATGWYILKDNNDETDFDYINLNNEMYTDVLRDISGDNQLKGKAVKITYQPTYYYHLMQYPDGTRETLRNQRVLHILSTKDMKAMNANNISVFKNYEDEFYELSETRAPQNCVYADGHLYLLNGGKCFSIYPLSSNIGKFSAPKIGIYGMHSDMMASPSIAMTFDTISHSFYGVSSGGTTLDKFADQEGAVSTRNLNVRLINLLQGSETNIANSTGYAIMQSLTDEKEHYVASVKFSKIGDYPFTSFDTIPQSCMMPQAPVKASPNMGSFIYYAYDNKLYVYKDAKDLADRESLLKEFPANEKISFIKNFLKTKTGGGYEYMYVAVLTNSPNGWKMYLFNLIGLGNPEIETTPAKIFEGKGTARHIMYR